MPGEPTRTLLDDLDAIAADEEEAANHPYCDPGPYRKYASRAARLRAAAARLREEMARVDGMRGTANVSVFTALERINAGPAAPSKGEPATCTHPKYGTDGRCLRCGDKVALAIDVEFAKRIAEIDAGKFPPTCVAERATPAAPVEPTFTRIESVADMIERDHGHPGRSCPPGFGPCPLAAAPVEKRCETWCGGAWHSHGSHGKEKFFQGPQHDRCFCTPACRAAGRPCHPMGKP